MTQTVTLEILKQAIMIEKRGYAFYRKVGEQAEDVAVKSFFESMAQEELSHIKVLTAQFKVYNEKKMFESGLFNENEEIQLTMSILNSGIIEKIAAAGFEAAAISASIALEQNSIDVYSRRAEEAIDTEEKKLYTWLATWERHHLKMLMEIDRALLDQAWSDSSFWPF
ncbi:MAG: ferritin family protein [Desulfamplus sp.]|nr:ferritin family protein [Desulfamplus sp.]MBF0411891.1 ferritin family protein [Desulfamplus sp.]